MAVARTRPAATADGSSIVLPSRTGPYGEALLSDSIEGMSGGPVLNREGELVGIYKGLLPFSKEVRDMPLASIFLSVIELSFVENFCDGLLDE